MQLVNIPSSPTKPQSQLIAEKMLFNLNASLAERIHDHKVNYNLFWNSSETPDKILEELNALKNERGNGAQIMLASASENLEHIGKLAALIGKTLTDALDDNYWKPRREFIINANGTITLAKPAEGYDAWGRLIPVPEPEPAPEVIEEVVEEIV